MANRKKKPDWCDNIPNKRPMSEWAYYRQGVINTITENEARKIFDNWKVLSCDRGAATLMIDQLWNEIDQLRAQLNQNLVEKDK